MVNTRGVTGRSGQNRWGDSWPPVGRISGRPWGFPVAAYGENLMATHTPCEEHGRRGESAVRNVNRRSCCGDVSRGANCAALIGGCRVNVSRHGSVGDGLLRGVHIAGAVPIRPPEFRRSEVGLPTTLSFPDRHIETHQRTVGPPLRQQQPAGFRREQQRARRSGPSSIYATCGLRSGWARGPRAADCRSKPPRRYRGGSAVSWSSRARPACASP